MNPNQPRKWRKIIIIVGVVSLMLLSVVIILNLLSSNKDKKYISANLKICDGGTFTINYPKAFIENFDSDTTIQLISPENATAKESIKIYGDSAAASIPNEDTLDDYIADAKKAGTTVEQVKKKDHEQVTFTSVDKKTNITTKEVNLLYKDYVWKITISHANGTVLDESLDLIIKSFTYKPGKKITDDEQSKQAN